VKIFTGEIARCFCQSFQIVAEYLRFQDSFRALVRRIGAEGTVRRNAFVTSIAGCGGRWWCAKNLRPSLPSCSGVDFMNQQKSFAERSGYSADVAFLVSAKCVSDACAFFDQDDNRHHPRNLALNNKPINVSSASTLWVLGWKE